MPANSFTLRFYIFLIKNKSKNIRIKKALICLKALLNIFNNIGNISSSKKISDTMTSCGRKISPQTVESYLSALVNSFILYHTGRYDVKGK